MVLNPDFGDEMSCCACKVLRKFSFSLGVVSGKKTLLLYWPFPPDLSFAVAWTCCKNILISAYNV